MMEFWKECATGSQITIAICLTVIILAIIALLFLGFCNCCEGKPKDSKGDNSSGQTPPLNVNVNNGNSERNKEDKEREIRQKQEDRAKALVKDMFEATREKKINAANQKEEKCDISVTKELIDLYEKVLKDMRTI